MEFEAFAERVDGIEGESGDIETVERVAALFAVADTELSVVARFVQGRVFPAWSSTTLDIGPSLCYEALAKAAGRNVFADDIDSLAAAGVTSGCNPPDNDRFCPHRTVTRAEMAMLLDPVLAGPSPESDVFGDDDGITAELAINSLARAGVTRGCRPEKFCPDRSLSRGEMAARRAQWRAPAYKANRGTLYKYIKNVKSASEGCVTDE
jgi:hypothetical protein